jgi:hypothetical protein
VSGSRDGLLASVDPCHNELDAEVGANDA